MNPWNGVKEIIRCACIYFITVLCWIGANYLLYKTADMNFVDILTVILLGSFLVGV